MKQWNIKAFLLRWVNFSAQEAYRKIKQEIRSVHNPSERIPNGFLSFTSSEDLELLDSLALREVKSFCKEHFTYSGCDTFSDRAYSLPPAPEA